MFNGIYYYFIWEIIKSESKINNFSLKGDQANKTGHLLHRDTILVLLILYLYELLNPETFDHHLSIEYLQLSNWKLYINMVSIKSLVRSPMANIYRINANSFWNYMCSRILCILIMGFSYTVLNFNRLYIIHKGLQMKIMGCILTFRAVFLYNHKCYAYGRTDCVSVAFVLWKAGVPITVHHHLKS